MRFEARAGTLDPYLGITVVLGIGRGLRVVFRAFREGEEQSAPTFFGGVFLYVSKCARGRSLEPVTGLFVLCATRVACGTAPARARSPTKKSKREHACRHERRKRRPPSIGPPRDASSQSDLSPSLSPPSHNTPRYIADVPRPNALLHERLSTTSKNSIRRTRRGLSLSLHTRPPAPFLPPRRISARRRRSLSSVLESARAPRTVPGPRASGGDRQASFSRSGKEAAEKKRDRSSLSAPGSRSLRPGPTRPSPLDRPGTQPPDCR